MITIHTFTFNPYQENTFVLSNQNNDCIIIDPGCYTASEQNELKNYITLKQLNPIYLLNTHCHIDHVLGNKFVWDNYGLKPIIHKNEIPVLDSIPGYAPMFGMQYEVSPAPEKFLEAGDKLFLGEEEFSILLTPGHSPGSICFYHPKQNFLIGGDALFQGSIGRTDLPGGDYDTLIHSIRTQLFTLPDEVVVYPGHGLETNIGWEKNNNPFFK